MTSTCCSMKVGRPQLMDRCLKNLLCHFLEIFLLPPPLIELCGRWPSAGVSRPQRPLWCWTFMAASVSMTLWQPQLMRYFANGWLASCKRAPSLTYSLDMFPWKNHCKDGSLHLMQWNARGSAAKFFVDNTLLYQGHPHWLTYAKDLESWKHLEVTGLPCRQMACAGWSTLEPSRWRSNMLWIVSFNERNKKTTIKHWLLHWSMSICGRRFEPLKTFDMKTGHWRPRRKSASVRGVMSLTVAAVVRLCLCLCRCGCGWVFGQVLGTLF